LDRATPTDASAGSTPVTEAAVGKKQGECAGPATHIRNPASAHLFGDRYVHLEVAAVGIQRGVDRRQPRVLEDVVSHSADRMPTAVAQAS
jgi:hypothetical protein